MRKRVTVGDRSGAARPGTLLPPSHRGRNLKPQQGLTPGSAGDAGFLPPGWERAAGVWGGGTAGNHRHREMSPTGCGKSASLKALGGAGQRSHRVGTLWGAGLYQPGPLGLKGLPRRRRYPHHRKDEDGQHLSTLHLALGAEGAGNQTCSTH